MDAYAAIGPQQPRAAMRAALECYTEKTKINSEDHRLSAKVTEGEVAHAVEKVREWVNWSGPRPEAPATSITRLLWAYVALTEPVGEEELAPLFKLDLLGGEKDYDILKAFRKALDALGRLTAERDEWKGKAAEAIENVKRMRLFMERDDEVPL